MDMLFGVLPTPKRVLINASMNHTTPSEAWVPYSVASCRRVALPLLIQDHDVSVSPRGHWTQRKWILISVLNGGIVFPSKGSMLGGRERILRPRWQPGRGWQQLELGNEAFPRLDFPRSRVRLTLRCHPFKGCMHRTITFNGAFGVSRNKWCSPSTTNLPSNAVQGKPAECWIQLSEQQQAVRDLARCGVGWAMWILRPICKHYRKATLN